ncbi:MAG: BMC domain-containing protein [Cellulosilyticaceae bacterium]
MGKAVGLIEIYGLATALYAIDAACKAADVTVEYVDKNKPANAESLAVPLLVMVKLRGSVADVTAGIEAAKKACDEIAGYVIARVIASPDEGLEEMLSINCL